MVAVTAGCRWNGDSDGAAEPSTTTQTAATTHTYTAEMDFGTVDVAGGGRIAVDFDSPQLEVGLEFTRHDQAGPAVLHFPPLDIESGCVAEAILRVTLATEARPDVPLAAYPVRPGAIPAAEGGEIPSWGLLIDNRPRGVFEVQGDIGQADVTELVGTWLSGGPFPSEQRVVDPAEPLAVSVQPEAGTSRATTRLFASESGDLTAPALIVTEGC